MLSTFRLFLSEKKGPKNKGNIYQENSAIILPKGVVVTYLFDQSCSFLVVMYNVNSVTVIVVESFKV